MGIEAAREVKLRRTAPKEVRRQQLIEATMDSIAENGISGTTMATVTRRAGLSMGIVSLHFESKENLLTSTLRYLAEEHRAVWVAIQKDASLEPAEKLWAIIDANFHPRVCTPLKIAVWFAFFGEARYRDIYRSMVEDFDTERALAVEELCQFVKDEGGYEGVDPHALAQSIESLADGLWLNLLLYPKWISLEQSKAQIFDLLVTHFPRHYTADGPIAAGGCAK
ncbi:TetR family transcriptional regulator [Pelagibius litoralis]|uniref:TetR family transcriptional regulator n=1 Tax=Pelagibius litoralis TaxID=374515 RepID=A0A967EXS2_9PROT|nr:TetR family transcriptional regulator C-terminal domain-containing protein [Pelagibius litoralis]NIA69354.1 TetR family transcriptional regulator [Pelagibius litoralis]